MYCVLKRWQRWKWTEKFTDVKLACELSLSWFLVNVIADMKEALATSAQRQESLRGLAVTSIGSKLDSTDASCIAVVLLLNIALHYVWTIVFVCMTCLSSFII